MSVFVCVCMCECTAKVYVLGVVVHSPVSGTTVHVIFTTPVPGYIFLEQDIPLR